MSIIHRVAGLSLRDGVRSLVIRGGSFGGVLGTTQNSLEGLYIPSGLGTPWNPPGGAAKHCLGKGGLEYPSKPFVSAI